MDASWSSKPETEQSTAAASDCPPNITNTRGGIKLAPGGWKDPKQLDSRDDFLRKSKHSSLQHPAGESKRTSSWLQSWRSRPVLQAC